jgi:hypothetical protein
VKPTARLIVAGVLSALILVSIGALASAGTNSSSSAAQYQYGKKVTICHKGKNTISVSIHAWPAHQAHGDTLGPCAQGKTNHGKKKGQGATHESTPTTTTASSTPSHGNGNGNSGGNGNGHGKK